MDRHYLGSKKRNAMRDVHIITNAKTKMDDNCRRFTSSYKRSFEKSLMEDKFKKNRKIHAP